MELKSPIFRGGAIVMRAGLAQLSNFGSNPVFIIKNSVNIGVNRYLFIPKARTRDI